MTPLRAFFTREGGAQAWESSWLAGDVIVAFSLARARGQFRASYPTCGRCRGTFFATTPFSCSISNQQHRVVQSPVGGHRKDTRCCCIKSPPHASTSPRSPSRAPAPVSESSPTSPGCCPLLTPCRRCWSHWPVPATGHPQVLFQLHPGPTVRQALQGRAVAHDDDAGGRFVLLGQPTPTGPAAQASGRPWSARRHPHGAGSRPPHPHGRRSGERRAYSSQTEPPPQRERPWLPAILCGATTMATWPFTSSRLVGFTPIRTDWKSSRGATAPMTCAHGIHSMHTGRARLKHGQSSGLAPLLRRSCSRPTRPPTLLKEPSCARTCASPPPQPPPPP